MDTLNDKYEELREQQDPPIFLIDDNDSFCYDDQRGNRFHVITISGLTYLDTPSVLILVLESNTNIYGFLVIGAEPINPIDIIEKLVEVSTYTNAAGISIHRWNLYLVDNLFFEDFHLNNLDNPNNVISIVQEETSGKSKIECLEFLKFHIDRDNNVIVEIYNKKYKFIQSRSTTVDYCYVYDVSSSVPVEVPRIGVGQVRFNEEQDNVLQEVLGSYQSRADVLTRSSIDIGLEEDLDSDDRFSDDGLDSHRE